LNVAGNGDGAKCMLGMLVRSCETIDTALCRLHRISIDTSEYEYHDQNLETGIIYPSRSQ
jgi:hypothetical protein